MANTNATKLRVLLIDFSPVIQAGLQSILATDSTIEVTGHVADGVEAILHMKKATSEGHPIDVVVTATRTPNMDGVQATRIIKEGFPDVGVLVLTEYDNDSHVIDAIHAGAGGYIFMTGMLPEALLESIHRVIEGGTQMKTALLRQAVDALLQNGRKTLAERTTEAAHLTDREVEVLRLMGNGDTNSEISQNLGISMDTVKKHVHSIINKMQARSRTHACIIAAQAGIVGKLVLVPKAVSA